MFLYWFLEKVEAIFIYEFVNQLLNEKYSVLLSAILAVVSNRLVLFELLDNTFIFKDPVALQMYPHLASSTLTDT
jgi:hypothetical protein